MCLFVHAGNKLYYVFEFAVEEHAKVKLAKLAHAFSVAARILNTVADISGTSASLSLTEAGWGRRLQDWYSRWLS